MPRAYHPAKDPTDVADIKAAVRERDGQRCTECGMTTAASLERYGRVLDVHRVNPDVVYSVDACVTLCRLCHRHKARKKEEIPYSREPVATPENRVKMVRLGSLLREARLAAGLTQQQVADRLREDRVRITTWESGQYAFPAWNLVRVTAAFGTTARKIAEEMEQAEAPPKPPARPRRKRPAP